MVVEESDPLKSLLSFAHVAFLPVLKNFEHCFSGIVKNEGSNFGDGRKGDSNLSKKRLLERCGSDDGVCFDGFVEKVRSQIKSCKGSSFVDDCSVGVRVGERVVGVDKPKKSRGGDGDDLQFGHLMRLLCDQLSHFPKFDVFVQDHGDLKAIAGNLEGKRSGIERYGSDNGVCFDGFVEKVRSQSKSGKDRSFLDDCSVGVRVVGVNKPKKSRGKDGDDLQFGHLMRLVCDQLSHFPKFDVFVQDQDDLKAIAGNLEGKRSGIDGFFGKMRFARVRGVSSVKDVGGESQTFKFVKLKELVERPPQIGRLSKDDERLLVQDFFRYSEAEGKWLFQELDRDGDGRVTLEDLEIAVVNRHLPRRYALEFMRRARSRLFSKSFGWNEFLSVMEQNEPASLRAYTNLRLSRSGMLQKDEILASLENAGLSATEDDATAVMHYLNTNYEESKSYARFRSFMALLPSEKSRRNSTRRADHPRVEIQTDSVIKTALAGGISCSFSTLLMHPIDTVKTQVQASSALSFVEILSKLPQLGLRGLYMGSIPAVVGQFLSHGLRTGICEVTKIAVINVAPSLPELQVESAGSFLGCFLGTTMRVPFEVLKQRLQAGQFNHVGEALVGTWQQDGLRGFFRGTGMTLCRELPFYVAGSGLYTESKKAVQRLLGRELEPWETVVVGAVSGGLTAVMTTPFDVIKTRMMIALQGEPTTMSVVALSILRHEGPLGLFRGAVPRFFWVAPLGAINFAGYELMRKAMG